MFKRIIRTIKTDAYKGTYAIRKSKDNLKGDLKSYKLLFDHGARLINEYETSALEDEARVQRWEDIKKFDNFESNKNISYVMVGLCNLALIVTLISIVLDALNGSSFFGMSIQILFMLFSLSITIRQQFFCICDKKNKLISKNEFFRYAIPYLFINYVDSLSSLTYMVIKVIGLFFTYISRPKNLINLIQKVFTRLFNFLITFTSFRSEYSKDLERMKQEMKEEDFLRKAKRKRKRVQDEDDE